MLMMCLNRRSQTNPVVLENGVFCINTLAASGAEIADIFAGRTGGVGAERFNVGEWMVLATGSPVLVPAVIAFDCRTSESAVSRQPQCVLWRCGDRAARTRGPGAGLSRPRL